MQQLSTKPGTDAQHLSRAFAWVVVGIIGWLLGTGSVCAQPTPPAVIYNTATSPLPDNAVAALCYDAPRARLWIGTDYGLVRLDQANTSAPVWTVYHATPGGLPNDAIRAIALADTAGTAVWVGTFSGGLARLDVAAGTWQVWSAATSPLPLDLVRSLAPEPGGGVWVGTAGGLAYRSAAGAWQVFTPFNSVLPSSNVAALVRDPVDSTVWIGTVNGGLARWRRGALRAYTLRTDNLPDNTVLALALDSLRRPLLGTAAAGVVRYLTDSTWATYGPLNSPNPAATILALAADSAGRWWLGTAEHGVVAWERGQWRPFAYRSAAGLPDSTIQAVAVGADGEMWFGLRSGGVARWRPGPLGMRDSSTSTVVPLGPNPVAAHQATRLTWSDHEVATVTVMDAAGRIVYRRENTRTLALPPLPPGLYVVALVGRRQRVAQRIVVQ